MPNEDEPECFKVWKEGMLPVDNLVTPKHHPRRSRLLQSSMQSKALQIVGVGNSSEDNMGNLSVHEVKVGEVFYGG